MVYGRTLQTKSKLSELLIQEIEHKRKHATKACTPRKRTAPSVSSLRVNYLVSWTFSFFLFSLPPLGFFAG